jgi:DNA mismatch repair protein MutS2
VVNRSSAEADLRELALAELEFHTVLGHVATYVHSSIAAERIAALRPMLDARAIQQEVDAVQEMVDVVAEGETFPLERLDDVRHLLQRSTIVGNFLTASELIAVHDALRSSRLVRRYVVDRSERSPVLASIVAPLVDDKVLERHITDAIDETGVVRDNASRELQSIRREIQETSQRLRSRLNKLVRKLHLDDVLQDDFITQREGRFVMPVRVENKRAIPGIIHGVSQTGSTVFLEPAETIDMNNELSILHNQELREIQRVLTVLTAEIGAHASAIGSAFDVLIHLDTLHARAGYALARGGIKPVLFDDATLELEQVRHPILVHQSSSTGGTVVPMGIRFDAKARGVLISGPNAGGKTVAMKTIGLAVAMSQSAIFPLGTCRLSPRRLFTAIGDHQSIDSNLSTFSSQIIRLRDILSYCSSDALVLVDEICAGTDPAEGGALAAGILDSLVERDTCFVVTTHQSSLKQYALSRPSIANASLAFDEDRMQPTFTFLPNVPGNSYAFALANSVGLPNVVMNRARTYLGDRHGELEQSIAAIQQYRRKAEEALRQASEQEAKARTLKADYEERLGTIRKQRASLVEDAREEAREVLRKAQALIERTVREVREQQRAVSDVKSDFEQERKELTAKLEQQPSLPPEGDATPLTVGMFVEVVGTQSVGQVLELENNGTSAVIEVNGMRFRFPVMQIRQTAKKAVARKRESADYLSFDMALSCDVRGKRADEAIRDIEIYLSDAILRHLPSAMIIHGKGTGALRKAIQEYLRGNPQYGTYRNGTLHEGGEGVTIVELL